MFKSCSRRFPGRKLMVPMAPQHCCSWWVRSCQGEGELYQATPDAVQRASCSRHPTGGCPSQPLLLWSESHHLESQPSFQNSPQLSLPDASSPVWAPLLSPAFPVLAMGFSLGYGPLILCSTPPWSLAAPQPQSLPFLRAVSSTTSSLETKRGSPPPAYSRRLPSSRYVLLSSGSMHNYTFLTIGSPSYISLEVPGLDLD